MLTLRRTFVTRSLQLLPLPTNQDRRPKGTKLRRPTLRPALRLEGDTRHRDDGSGAASDRDGRGHARGEENGATVPPTATVLHLTKELAGREIGIKACARVGAACVDQQLNVAAGYGVGALVDSDGLHPGSFLGV